MANVEKQPLKVFLCHASGDKPAVRDLYKRLTVEGVDAWLDQEKLLPGQDWRMEIPRAVREADVVVICISNKSITKEGYVQKEIKFALDYAEEKPDGTIFLIPARLDECVIPERLSRWQWVDLFDDNGFIKLLRSLKLRAIAVGATIEPTSYVDSDKELERKLEQYYTEGLAAFYTEDWDKACQRFQMILSERPNHKNAAKKLAQAEQQRDLAKLYKQAMGEVEAENWISAVQTLEKLSQKTSDYKDVSQLLKNARKQKRLNELYIEAKALHTAQKWKAVVKVFERISAVDPNYPDADGLLESAQTEVIELERLAKLNDQYSHAIHEMDSGNWHEARVLLEQIHKSEIGFRETEKLLKKVESEILRQEEERKQRDQISTLYEQAHGLLRSKKWQNALDKLEEIRKLDDQFPDTDGIMEKAQKELTREEQEAERQNQLAALYAEAVRLLKENKYQDALDKWHEVKEIDSKYPDRQKVQKTARKKLVKEGNSKEKIPILKNSFFWGGVAFVLLIVFAVSYPTDILPNSTPQPTQAAFLPTMTPSDIPLNSTPQPTQAAFLPTMTPSTSYMWEIPIRIKIATSSDWFRVNLVEGGDFSDVVVLSYSSLATQARYDGTYFLLNQELESANEGKTVEMVVEASLINISETELVLQVDSGCLGETSIELFNALAEPVLVKTLSGITPCDDQITKYIIPAQLFTDKVDVLDIRTLFFDDFNEGVLRNTYKELSSATNGSPEYSFEVLDDSSVIRLKNRLRDYQVIGWEISDVFNASPIRVEIRFNTLRQSLTTSIDGFLEVRLIAADYSNYYVITMFAGNWGQDWEFTGIPIDLKNNTWYRLVIAGTQGQKYRASLYDDLLETELVGKDLVEIDTDFFEAGMRIGISQGMGAPEGEYPVDVAIDWIRITTYP